MSSDNTLNKIDISKMTLTGNDGRIHDLSNIFISINIYEDILANFIVAKFVFVDASDLMKNVPIIGKEKFKMIFKANSDEQYKELNLIVYKPSPEQKVIEKHVNGQMETLFLISVEAFDDKQIRLSKKYSGTADSIISKVLIDSLNTNKNMDLESATNNINIYASYWCPFKVINFASSICKSDFYDFIFYEDMDGFKFKSLSTLMSQSPKEKWAFSNNSQETIAGYNLIKKYTTTQFDLMFNIYRGNFGSTFYKQDHIYTDIIKKEYDFKSAAEKWTTLGNNVQFPSDMQTKQNKIEIRHHDPEIEMLRKMSLSSLINYNLITKMNGSVERKIGEVIDIDLPTKDNESIIHENLTGNWLIIQCNHIIQNDMSYEQNFRLVKNAFFNQDKLSSISSHKNM